MHTAQARFAIGQVIHHKLFDYRGVIIDVDQSFQGTEEWYQQMATSSPPKDLPWYHILVHNAVHRTYAAECNLELDNSGKPIEHPELETYFDEFVDGHYLAQSREN